MLRQVIDLASLVPTLGFDSGSTLASVTETDASQNLELALTSSAALSAGETVAVAVSATPAGADRDAAAGADYTAVTSASLSAGTTHMVVIPIAGDVIVEPDETFVVTLAAVGAAYTIDAAASSSTVTITDNDTAALTFGPAPTPETDAEFTLSASLGASVQVPATTVEPRSALTFRDSGTSTDLIFTDTDGNGIIELGERNASVTLTHPTAETVNFDFDFAPAAQHGLVAADFTAGTIDVTVTQAPPAMFQFMEQAMSVKEADEDTTLTFRLMSDKALGSAQTVGLRFGVTGEAGDVDASSGDYVSMESVTFPANETTATFDVTIKGDLIVEGDEKFTVTLVDTGDAYALGSASVAVATIEDNDDSAATITFSLVAEDRSALTAPPSTGPVRVRALLHKKGDTDTLLTPSDDIGFYIGFNPPDKWGGGDAQTVSDEITIAAGESTVFSKAISLFHPAAVSDAPIAMVAWDDNRYDIGDFRLSDVPSSFVALGEPPPPPTLEFAAPVYLHTETDAESSLQVSLTVAGGTLGGDGGAVNVTIGADTDADTMDAAASDYGTVAAVAVGASDTTVTFNVPIKGDQVVEPDETFVLTLVKAGDVYDLGSQSTTLVTIVDDDDASLELVSTTPATLVAGGTYTLTARLTAPVQFAARGAPITFYEGETATTVSLGFTDKNNDGVITGDAELVATARSNGADHSFTAPNSEVEKILLRFRAPSFSPDPDTVSGLRGNQFRSAGLAPAIAETARAIFIERAEYEVTEARAPLPIKVILSSPRSQDLDLLQSRSAIVTPGTLSLGDDGRTAYQHIPLDPRARGSIFSDYRTSFTLPVIPAGVTEVTLDNFLTINEDDVYEADEIFQIAFIQSRLPPDVIWVGGPTIVTILDDDPPPVMSVDATYTAPEAGRHSVVDIKCDREFGFPVTVNYRVSASGVFPAQAGDVSTGFGDKTADLKGQYHGKSLGIGCGDELVYFLRDILVEPSETFTVTLLPGDDYTLGSSVTTAATIQDGNRAGLMLTAPRYPDVNEEFSITAMLDDDLNRVVVPSGGSLTFKDSGGTGAPDIVFRDADNSGGIDRGAVTVKHSRSTAGDVALSYVLNPSPQHGLVAGQFPDDPPTVTVGPKPALAIYAESDGGQADTVTEGATASFEVGVESLTSITRTVSVPVSITDTPASGDYGATAGEDFTAVTSISVPPLAKADDRPSFNLQTLVDTVVEPDETLYLSIVGGDDSPVIPYGVDNGYHTWTLTIEDDDTAEVTVTVTPVNPEPLETMTLTVKLGADVQVAAGDSITFSDYSDTGTTVTFTDANSDGFLKGAELTATATYTHPTSGEVEIAYILDSDRTSRGLKSKQFIEDDLTVTVSPPDE